MIADAEQHRDEDHRLRELTDARNELDAAAYAVEHLLAERGDAVAMHEKARAEALAGDARQALKGDTPLERLKELTLSSSRSTRHWPHRAQPRRKRPAARTPEPLPSDADDDVIDAEFTAHE